MDKDSDSMVTAGTLAEACVLFALAAGGGSALKDESQTEFLRRVGKALDEIERHAPVYAKQGKGRKKPGSTPAHAVEKFVKRGSVEIIRKTRRTSGRPYAINCLTLSEKGWEEVQELSNDSPDIVHLMPERWQFDAPPQTPPQTLLAAAEAKALGDAVRTVLREEEVIKTLLWIRHDLNTLVRQLARVEERIKNIPRPSGTALLADVFSSLAAIFNPPSKT